MRITDAPRAVFRLQYRIARIPLQLIEDRVVARMDSEAPARLFYEGSLGRLDATVGNALGDSALVQRGRALAKRSDDLGRAARLDESADRAKQQSAADLKATADRALAEQNDARAAKERAVEEARTSAEQRKREAADAAAQRTAAAKSDADEVAAQRTKAAEAAKRQEQSKVQAYEKRATAAANSKLQDAADRRDEASAKRAQADRIEDLAETEKRKRQ